MSDIVRITDSISGLSVQSSHDDIANAIIAVDFLRSGAKEVADQLKAKMIEWLTAHGGEVTIGPVRHYLGHPKKYKVRNIKEALDILMQLSGGDLEKFSAYFASSLLKHGFIRDEMNAEGCPEKFESVFEMIEDVTWEEGKPKRTKQLMRSDDRFNT